jgi:hypothetical protein
MPHPTETITKKSLIDKAVEVAVWHEKLSSQPAIRPAFDQAESDRRAEAARKAYLEEIAEGQQSFDRAHKPLKAYVDAVINATKTPSPGNKKKLERARKAAFGEKSGVKISEEELAEALRVVDSGHGDEFDKSDQKICISRDKERRNALFTDIASLEATIGDMAASLPEPRAKGR